MLAILLTGGLLGSPPVPAPPGLPEDPWLRRTVEEVAPPDDVIEAEALVWMPGWDAAKASIVLAAVRPSGRHCAVFRITNFARQEFPGAMRDTTSTRGQVGLAAAVGVDGRNRPLMPLGTTVWIDGVGPRTIRDTGAGGAGWLDVLVETRAEALHWGIQRREVCW